MFPYFFPKTNISKNNSFLEIGLNFVFQIYFSVYFLSDAVFLWGAYPGGTVTKKSLLISRK